MMLLITSLTSEVACVTTGRRRFYQRNLGELQGNPGRKCLHFHAVFRIDWSNNKVDTPPCPPGGWRPMGNSGSATQEEELNTQIAKQALKPRADITRSPKHGTSQWRI